MTQLITKSLSVTRDGKTLIRDISLTFSHGFLYGILGPNGSGKSTFLKALTGIWPLSSGKISWGEEDLLHKERRAISKILALVPQNPQVPFNFTVSEIVAMGRYAYGGSADIKHVEEVLTIVDAWHLKSRSILCLSQGERKRVYIARALITESPILLLDEPEASLDIRHQLEIWELLRQLAKKGKIVIITSHDLLSSERFCDKVAVLNQGQCLGFGTYSQVVTKEVLKEVFGVMKEDSNLEKESVPVFFRVNHRKF